MNSTHSLLHVGNEVLHLGDLVARHVVVLGRVHHREVHLLVLELELRALDRLLQLGGRLVPQALVELLRPVLRGVLARRGDGRELERKGKLEVRLSDDLRLLGEEF